MPYPASRIILCRVCAAPPQPLYEPECGFLFHCTVVRDTLVTGGDAGGGRHHPGQALGAEDRVGDVAWEWQASPRGAGHQPGFSALDRGYSPDPLRLPRV